MGEKNNIAPSILKMIILRTK